MVCVYPVSEAERWQTTATKVHMRMNKYDYARTFFSLQWLRIFSILLTLGTTLFITLTVINLFTREWDYPPFLLLILPLGYGIAFLVWKLSTASLKKAKEEFNQLLHEEEKTNPGAAKKGRIVVILIQIAIALFIVTILGNFISSHPRHQGQKHSPTPMPRQAPQQESNSDSMSRNQHQPHGGMSLWR
jgi:signal transduction histidine kinase